MDRYLLNGINSYMRIKELLMEGGNVFDGTTPFNHNVIPDILKIINGALKETGIKVIPVGSGATPTPGKISNDLDAMVDEADVLAYFKAADAKTGRQALGKFLKAKNLDVTLNGVNVHVKVPVGDEFHQVDLMVVPNASKIAKFHTHKLPANSPFKGVNKQLMLAILAKEHNMMWSAWQGLFSRNAEGKKDKFLGNDIDQIAKLLFGKNATGANLDSVESILKSLPKDKADSLLAKCRLDPNWKEIK